MAAKIHLFLPLIAIVGCQCEPNPPQVSWGVGGSYKGNLDIGANGKLGARGVSGEAGVYTRGGLHSYAYVAKGRPDQVSGVGVFSDVGYEAGAKGNLPAGGPTPATYGAVSSNRGYMTREQLEAKINKYNRIIQSNVPTTYGVQPPTEGSHCCV